MSADPEAGPPAAKLSRPMSLFYRITSLPPPPPPPKDNGYRPNTPLSRPNTAATTRPNTATTRRFSRSTTVSTQRTIKYATWGRFRGTELSPQPSDDPEDPLVCGTRSKRSRRWRWEKRPCKESEFANERRTGLGGRRNSTSPPSSLQPPSPPPPKPLSSP